MGSERSSDDSLGGWVPTGGVFVEFSRIVTVSARLCQR